MESGSNVRVLLFCQANIHFRNCKGQGILRVAQIPQRRLRSDSPRYARITAWMALVIDAGAVAEPTYSQEWTTQLTSMSKTSQTNLET